MKNLIGTVLGLSYFAAWLYQWGFIFQTAHEFPALWVGFTVMLQFTPVGGVLGALNFFG
ncbi:hypothetical protein [Aeromonas phage 32]|nr:hypothetical protein [Aeromonas phage 32]